MTSGSGQSAAEFTRMWHRQLPWWHAVYAVVWAAVVIAAFLDEPGPHGRWPEVACLLGMGVVYLALGDVGMRHQRPTLAVIYHVLSWTLLLGAQVANPGTESTMMFFVLFPQLWAMLTLWQAVTATALAVTAYGLVRWYVFEFDPAVVPRIVMSSLISAALSMALGLFITRIVREAESRAETIDELNQTRAQLAAVERDQGVHEERERLSREIHDTLAQGFTSVVTLARASQSALSRGDAATAAQRLALIEATAVENLSEARLIVAELSPAHLQSRSLTEALQRLVDSISTESGTEVTLTVRGEPAALGGAADVVLLRSAQEALSNVRRHAEARVATVELTYREHATTLVVRDDGRGFDPAVSGSGFGLDGTRARASQVGGRVEVSAPPGQGTTVTVEVPR